MNEPKNKLTEKEMKFIEDTEAFMDEVYDNPEVAEAEPPSVLRKRVFAEIYACQAAKKEEFCVEEETNAKILGTEEKAPEVEKLSAEEKELIRLGRIYKKRKRLQKYVVLAAVLILAMAFGMTSIGGPKKVFEMVKSTLMGREQINVDSDEIRRVTEMSEEEAYREIEETFGFIPVGLGYFPKDVIFLDGKINEETQSINLIYGKDEMVKLTYFIRPNYRVSSFGKDIEDNLLEEYIEENEYTTIHIRKHLVDEKEERWSVQCEYNDVCYSVLILDTTREEVEKIVENLYFP